MAFYTNILRYKNFILHRGYYDNGERFARKEYFQPKLFDHLLDHIYLRGGLNVLKNSLLLSICDISRFK